MKFINPLPFVSDVHRAKAFYETVLELRVLEDHGDFVKFENGFALHSGSALLETIFGEKAVTSEPFGRRNFVLYFEEPDIDAAFERIAPRVRLIHPIERQNWGQRVFRFYDPDEHIIELGEPQ